MENAIAFTKSNVATMTCSSCFPRCSLKSAFGQVQKYETWRMTCGEDREEEDVELKDEDGWSALDRKF